MNKLPSENTLRLLEAYHEFPGEYTFKIIGPNGQEWQDAIRQAASGVLGDVGKCLQVSNHSRQGTYQSLTLTVHVESSQMVLKIYAALQKVPGVKMLV